MASPHCGRRRMNISTVYGHPCGLFLCITAAHLVSDAKLPDIQANIKVTEWRRHPGEASHWCGPHAGEIVCKYGIGCGTRAVV